MTLNDILIKLKFFNVQNASASGSATESYQGRSASSGNAGNILGYHFSGSSRNTSIPHPLPHQIKEKGIILIP